MAGVPSITDVRDWCMVAQTAITDDQLQVVIDGELTGQAMICRVPEDPAEYPSQLAQALYRRVARVLSGRQVPLGIVGDAASEYGATRLATFDPEIERIEGPTRIVVFG